MRPEGQHSGLFPVEDSATSVRRQVEGKKQAEQAQQAARIWFSVLALADDSRWPAKIPSSFIPGLRFS